MGQGRCAALSADERPITNPSFDRERMQTRYPQLLCNLAEGAFTVTDPEPKPGLLRLARRQAKRDGVSIRELAADGWAALRSFG